MALDVGSVTLRRYFPAKKLPVSSDESWLKGIREHRFTVEPNLQPGIDNIGWAVYNNELSSDFDAANLLRGRFLRFSLRIDSMKVPKKILDLHLRDQLAQISEGGQKVIPKVQKLELREKIIHDLSTQLQPDMTLVPILVDPTGGCVYVASTSKRANELVVQFFERSFDVELYQADFLAVAQKKLNKQVFDLLLKQPGGLGPDLTESAEVDEGPSVRLGSCFLTWLLYRLQEEEAEFEAGALGHAVLYADEYVLLEGVSGAAKQTLLKKGDGTVSSPELKSALRAGKLVAKVRCFYLPVDSEEDKPLTVTLGKKCFDLAGIKTPRSIAQDPDSRELDRLTWLTAVYAMADNLLGEYLEARTGKGWKKLRRQIEEWIQTDPPVLDDED